MSDVSDVRLRKAELRAQVLARRSALPADQRAAAGTLIRDAVLAEPQVQMAGTIAAYYSIGAEPGTHGLVFALYKRGSYVLLPVLRPDGDLDWASYEGPDSMVPGPRGLLEPGEPPRGVDAVARADAVLVPALAVDGAGARDVGGCGGPVARPRGRKVRPRARPGRPAGPADRAGLRRRTHRARADRGPRHPGPGRGQPASRNNRHRGGIASPFGIMKVGIPGALPRLDMISSRMSRVLI